MLSELIIKQIFKSIAICVFLFLSDLKASGSYFNISLSTSDDRILINTDTDYDIYGYQFQITNISLTDCFDSSGSNFYISVGQNGNIVALSLSGTVISSGQNTILSCLIVDNQNIDNEGSCLDPDSVIISSGASVGGISPQIPGSEIVVGDCLYLDCSNELNGDDSDCLDCAGVPNGTYELDCLGVCGDPSSENFAIQDLCGNCLGSCISPPIIDCDCEIINISGVDTIICTGNCDPTTYTDPCFVWNSETWIDAVGGIDLFYDEGEELNDTNSNGLADIGCYDCGGNSLGDDNYDVGNIFREYSCMNPDLFNTQFYCSALINNNIGNDGSCLSNYNTELVSQFSLFSAYPNPFNPITTVNYSVKHAGNIKIDIYNILGEHVYTLVDEYHAPGNLYQISWDSNNQSNIPISSGIYFIKAEHANAVLIQELTLIK
tara:strand:- start:1638 stop:2939 length:1302 start_codon:yes stop_codon:yes gene_type:complete